MRNVFQSVGHIAIITPFIDRNFSWKRGNLEGNQWLT